MAPNIVHRAVVSFTMAWDLGIISAMRVKRPRPASLAAMMAHDGMGCG